VTKNCKAIHFNIITPLLSKRKNLSLSLLLENACSQFYGTTDVRGLLEKYPTFGREKETGLPGALDT
jgi:hypothetical protein